MKSIIYICLVLVPLIKSDDPLPPLPEDGSCVLDHSYQDGCYVCTCFAEKALICKRKEDCFDKDGKDVSPTHSQKETGSVQKCQEGETKEGLWGGCSFCACKKEKDGVNEWHCSDKDCKIYRRKRESGTVFDLKSTPCAPNDSFKLGCNTCYCNRDRSGYHCTEFDCDRTIDILVPQYGNIPAALTVPPNFVDTKNITAKNESLVGTSEVASTGATPSTTTTNLELNSPSSEAKVAVTLPTVESTSTHIEEISSSTPQPAPNSTTTASVPLR